MSVSEMYTLELLLHGATELYGIIYCYITSLHITDPSSVWVQASFHRPDTVSSGKRTRHYLVPFCDA